MTSVAQQLPVSLTPVGSADYVGAHRAGPAPRATRLRPWVHRGLAVGTLAGGLWLLGWLSQASAAEAAPSSAPPPPAASSTGGASAALGLPFNPVAVQHSSRSTTAPASRGRHVNKAQTSTTGSAAAGAVGGFGTRPLARSGVAGASSATSSGVARRSVSAVVTAAAGVIRSVSAGSLPPLPAVPVLRTPPLAVPALPGPASLVPAVLVPALPVVPARPAVPARALPAAQPAAPPVPPATGRHHSPSSDSAWSDKPAGHHPCQRPISETEVSTALPQQPATPPAGHRPSTVPGLGLGGEHHPLDSGLAPTDLSGTGVKPAGDCRGRDHTPPRERASLPSTSPD